MLYKPVAFSPVLRIFCAVFRTLGYAMSWLVQSQQEAATNAEQPRDMLRQLKRNLKYDRFFIESEHSKSDLQGHRYCHSIGHIQLRISLLLQCVSILHHFRDIMMYFQKFMSTYLSEHIPFGGNVSCAHLVLLCVNRYTALFV